MSKTLLIFLCTLSYLFNHAQTKGLSDTGLNYHHLPEIKVVSNVQKSDWGFLPEVSSTEIHAGKKQSVVFLKQANANLATNNMRQILAKVPGIHIWESDPSGLQIGIAARGLSPNRSWEFNIRQNGNDIAADPFGYPEAYYNPPMEAVKQIEIVRGQGALQYGPQFGGSVNYILKDASESSKKWNLEFQQTIGGNQLSSSFFSLAAQSKQAGFYAFYHQRTGDGWRQNSRYTTQTGYISFFQKWGKLKLENNLLYANMLSQQPGGLPDSLVRQDARKSFRSRNWMNIKWFTPSFKLSYVWREGVEWNLRLFGVIGQRNSIGYTKSIQVKDSINPLTMQYSQRVLQRDAYVNVGLESRFITGFSLFGRQHRFSAGIRLFKGNTNRLGDGTGSTGTEYDDYVIGNYQKDIHFNSDNIAVFSEALIHVNKRWILIPGIRWEWIEGAASGRNGWSNDQQPIMLNETVRSRKFILAGIGTEYHLNTDNEFYANLSQAYRPVQFSNLLAPPGSDVVDPNLSDAKGFNLDLGCRGKFRKIIIYDVSLFMLQYNNRVGTIQVQDNMSNYRLITNVGNSYSRGIESVLESKIYQQNRDKIKSELSTFASYSFTHARYSQSVKDSVSRGKQVENVPAHIFRFGFNWGYNQFSFSWQGSYTSATFSDAGNTILPNASFQIGQIPAYWLMDLTMGYKFNDQCFIKTGINNLTNQRYFTRRSGGFPGPGALPGDGINYFISFGKTF